MISDAERVDARRFCGYPAYGAGAAGNAGWRFFQAYGLMEYRLNNLLPEEEAVLRTQLATVRALERGLAQASTNLDTDQAATWTRNRSEVEDRTRLLDDWRRRLCAFLGLPPGPGLAGAGPTRALVI